jgi:outer membrane protein OmpA-like peptidoglycan-associated protein
MPNGLKRAACILLIALAVYGLLGFLILPGIALRVANQQLTAYATVPAHLERLELNPFSLELTLWGLHLGEPGKEQIAFQRLHANLQLDSLWSGALHLADLELERSRTEVLFAKDGSLNLTQLFKLPPSEPVAEKPASKPFPLRIDRLRLIEGGLHFQDLRPSEPIDFAYDSLNLELHNLSTLPEDNAEMDLVATGPDGARLDWNGNVTLVPVTSSGRLKITDARLKTFWPYVRDAVPLVLEDGIASFATDYKLDLSKQTELQLEHASLTLAPFAIKSPDEHPLVRLERLEASEVSLDLAKRQVVIGQLRSQKLQAWAAREADGELDWQKLFATQQSPSHPAPAPAPAPAPGEQATAAVEPGKAVTSASPPPAEPAKPWQIQLLDGQLRDYQLHLADRVPEQDVAVELGPLNLDIQHFDSLGKSPFDLKLDTGIGAKGHLQTEGQVQLSPVSARLQVATRAIDLRVAQAYLSPFIRMELRSGFLDSDLAVDLKSTEPLAFNVTGKARVSQLHTLDTIKERDFVKWREMQVDDIDYRHEDSLSIGKVSLRQPYARFIINEDLTTNVNDLLIAQPAEATPKAAGKGAPGKPLAIRIGGISVANGSANFADFSLTPNFGTAIQQLNGNIGTLDNAKPIAASVDIKGKVDRYAPVSIKGRLTPFDPLGSLDIATSFRNVELTTLTPYAGKFAGYRIRKGRLNLDLHYRIEKGLLNAENKLLLENLQLGEKVDSPTATDLPVRLAVALLKDTQGRIDIELPVKGDLNNPQFSVMPIVWQTLRNLVLRAAQAPFKFIAGLVGGSNVDLSQVQFQAGSSELDGGALKSLDTLAEALKKRPLLRLEIEGMSAMDSDGPLLAEQRLQREYQSTAYKMLQRRGEQVPADASELEVSDGDKDAMLEAIYRARLKQQPPAEWQALGGDERKAKLREAVLASWARSTLLLRQLGQARAASIKQYLVEKGGLEEQRVYLLDASLSDAKPDGSVSTELHLGAE